MKHGAILEDRHCGDNERRNKPDARDPCDDVLRFLFQRLNDKHKKRSNENYSQWRCSCNISHQ